MGFGRLALSSHQVNVNLSIQSISPSVSQSVSLSLSMGEQRPHSLPRLAYGASSSISTKFRSLLLFYFYSWSRDQLLSTIISSSSSSPPTPPPTTTPYHVSDLAITTQLSHSVSHSSSHLAPHLAPLTPSANRASKKPASHHPFSSNTRARPRVTAARIINSQRLHHHLAESCLTPSHVASQPPRPGPAMEAPGDFRELVCLPASHWPSRRLADNPPTPPSTSSACTCSRDGVHSLLREHLALSPSLSQVSPSLLSRTHILTAVAAAAAVIHPPSAHPLHLASICPLRPFPICLLPPQGSLQSHFSTHASHVPAAQ